MTTVSVIIPTWNRAQTIAKAIQSALDQTVPVLEVLVCDDGSTDSTREVVQGFFDKRVLWVEGPHSGLPALPRNRGLALAAGKWVAFLDSDDEWLPNKLEAQFECIERQKVKAISCNAFRILPTTYSDSADTTPYFPDSANRYLSLDDLLTVNKVICSSALIHRQILTQVGGFPESPNLKAIEDYATWLKVVCITPLFYLHEPLVNYYDNPSESIRRDDVSPNQQKQWVLQYLKQWLEESPSEVDQRQKDAIQRAERVLLTKLTGSKKNRLFRAISYLLRRR